MAKTAMRHVSFQIKTLKAAISPIAAALALMVMAAALPLLLITGREPTVETIPYIVIDIDGEAERYAPIEADRSLPRPGRS
ncbi:MAG: hypothetical protein AAGI89_12180 [Pseudomonadota bacterium]